ncbi:MAG: tetratricopeptide repeat protein [Chloroflexota bacterium]
MRPRTLPPSIRYLLREAALVLGFSYFVLAGGTLNGVMRFHLRLISQALLVILFAVWWLDRLRQRERLARSSLDGPVLAFLIVQLFSALLSTDPRRSLAFCGQWVVYALWFYLLRDLLRHGWPAELVIKSLLIVGGILVGLGLAGLGAQWLTWQEMGGHALPLTLFRQRFYSLLGDPNMTAGLLNLLWPLALARLVSTRGRGARALLSLWLMATLFVQLLTQSLGGLAGWMVSGLATLWLLLLIARPSWLVRRWAWVRDHKLARRLLALFVVGLAGGSTAALVVGGHLAASRGALWAAAWQTFVRSPLWGSGPFTFGTQLLCFASTPPYPVYPHAHNYWLNTAAETGLLGLLASIWVAAALAAAVLRRWRGATSDHRRLMAGAVGSLLGFATHSLADNHIILPGIGLLLVAVLALALHGDEAAPSETLRTPRHSVAWLALPALILIAGSLWSGGAYWRFELGRRLAADERWADAALWMQQATEVDPRLAFYWFQRGFVHSLLAAESQSPAHLEAAITSYQRGLALEPNWALNHASLAALYWTAGRQAEAISEMEQAIQLAPDASLFHLNLGRFYEAMSRYDDATVEYERFLALSPHLDAAYFWRQTPFRQQLAAAWAAAHALPVAQPDAQTPVEFLALGWQEYRAGRYATALAAFERASDLQPTSAEAAHGLALTHLALGDEQQADFFFALANLFLVRSNRPEPLLDWGQLAYRQGKLDRAITRYQAALSLVEEYSVYGPGTLGWSPYGNFLFQRESITRELAPQLVRIDVTDDLALRYLELAEWYQEAGDVTAAMDVYRRVLAHVPDLTEAEIGRQRLE